MEALLAPFIEAFGQDRMDALRASAVLDPVESFLQRESERSRWSYRYELEQALGDLRPASLWGALSVPPRETIAWLMSLELTQSEEHRMTAFLRFCRDLGYVPSDPELNEWLDEDWTAPDDE
jgi:hypothetical protein